MTRMADSTQTQLYYELEHRISANEIGIKTVCDNFLVMKNDMQIREDELKNAIKELALSQTQQELALNEIQSGIKALTKVLVIGVPFLSLVFGSFWSYHLNIMTQIQKNTYSRESSVNEKQDNIVVTSFRQNK